MTRFTTIPLASLLFLLLALPATAGHGDERSDRNDRRAKVERTDRKVQNFRSDRFAAPRVARSDEALRRTAHDLETQTRKLLRHAIADTPDPTRRERRALQSFRRLHREARELHASVEQNRRLRPALRDYREVERAFQQARHTFRQIDPDKQIRRDMRRVASTLNRIEDRFAPVISKAAWGHANHGYDVAWHR